MLNNISIIASLQFSLIYQNLQIEIRVQTRIFIYQIFTAWRIGITYSRWCQLENRIILKSLQWAQ